MKNIVDTAVNAGNFKNLVTAVKAADLVDTLSGSGPFTVFAPSDDAFAKIPKQELNKLLKDKPMLRKVLTYHVIPGKVMSTEVGGCVKTVEGSPVCFDTRRGVKVQDANITGTDIQCSNGVIHVIDSVMMPN